MRKDIHPKTHLINVERTDGTTFQVFSTWGEPGKTMKLAHARWTGKKQKIVSSGQISKFTRRFSGLESLS